MRNKNIGVFFGSRSTEHDISIITAQLIISGLKDLEYNVVPVYINRNGSWMFGGDLDKLGSFTDPKKDIDKKDSLKEYYLDMEQSNKKMVFKKKSIIGKEMIIDIAFPAFHGPFGEDGTIQGLFEMFNLPFIGCDVASSAIAMDKALTKQICKAHNISTTKFIDFYKQDWEKEKQVIMQKISDGLKWPVFVKPVHLGSSIGIAKVIDKDLSNLENKIDVALHYDNKVLVEEAVPNLIDLTCCVIGNEQLRTSFIQESVFQADLFDFDEKYLKEGGSQFGKSDNGVIIPARVDKSITKKVQDLSKEIYKAIGCTGIARVDFLFNKETQELFVNEINPLPGTLYHHLWKASGLEFSDLLTELIRLAEDRYRQRKSVDYSFNSSVLSSLNSKKLKIKE